MNLKFLKGAIALSMMSLMAAPAFGAATQKPADPELVDTSATAGGVCDSSTPYNSTYPASKAFDGKWASMYDNTTYSSDCWIAKMTNDYPVAYLVYKFNAPTRVNAISLFTPGESIGWGTATRAPKDWKLARTSTSAVAEPSSTAQRTYWLLAATAKSPIW